MCWVVHSGRDLFQPRKPLSASSKIWILEEVERGSEGKKLAVNRLIIVIIVNCDVFCWECVFFRNNIRLQIQTVLLSQHKRKNVVMLCVAVYTCVLWWCHSIILSDNVKHRNRMTHRVHNICTIPGSGNILLELLDFGAVT